MPVWPGVFYFFLFSSLPLHLLLHSPAVFIDSLSPLSHSFIFPPPPPPLPRLVSCPLFFFQASFFFFDSLKICTVFNCNHIDLLLNFDKIPFSPNFRCSPWFCRFFTAFLFFLFSVNMAEFHQPSALRKFKLVLAGGDLWINAHWMAELSPYFQQ